MAIRGVDAGGRPTTRTTLSRAATGVCCQIPLTSATSMVLALSSAAMAAIGIALGTLGRWMAGRIWATEATV